MTQSRSETKHKCRQADECMLLISIKSTVVRRVSMLVYVIALSRSGKRSRKGPDDMFKPHGSERGERLFVRSVLCDRLQVEHESGDEDRCQSGSTVAISLREEVEIGIGRSSRRNPDNEGALVDRRTRIAD